MATTAPLQLLQGALVAACPGHATARIGDVRRGSKAPLLAAARKEFLTPLHQFGASSHVYGRVHKAGQDVYLLVASPDFAPNDAVYAVGWARNDYWAVQVWGFDGHGYRNDCDPEEAHADPPSLESEGWPHPLRYGETWTCAKRLAKKPVMVSARYNGTEGAFRSHVMYAAPRLEFHYDSPNPEPADTPAAIQLGLGGRRWEQHQAEGRAKRAEFEGRTQS